MKISTILARFKSKV